MTRHNIPNPFAAQSPIGASIANLGQAIFGGRLSPTELEKQRLETDFLRARTDTLNADLATDTRQRASTARIAELLGGAEGRLRASVAPDTRESAIGPFRPGVVEGQQTAFDKAALPLQLAQAGASSVSSPQDLANLFNFTQANTPSTTDAERFAALIGRGITPGVNEAVSLGGQTDIADRNLQAQIRENAARIEATGVPARNVIDPNTGRAISVPRTVAALPAGSERKTLFAEAPGAVASAATETSALGLNKPVVADVQRAVLAMKDFNIVIDTVVDTAEKNPNMFGLVGNVLRLAQDIRGQASALMATFSNGKDFTQISAELAQANVAPEFFDPALANLPRLATLAAYSAASALAQQTGRALSDKDFILFRRIVGDPTDFFSTQAKFLSGMKLMRALANRLLESQVNTLRKGLGGVAAGGEAPNDDSDEAIMRRLGL